MSIRQVMYGRVTFKPYMGEAYRGSMEAKLLAGDDPKPVLHLLPARMARVDGAMLITGIESFTRGTKSSPTRVRQAWLCAPSRELGVEILDRWRAIKPRSVGGFDPEDDDVDDAD